MNRFAWTTGPSLALPMNGEGSGVIDGGSRVLSARPGDKAILVARFVLGLRTWASMLAGMARMPFWRFQLFSAAGGLAWAAAIGVAGYLLGSNLPLLETIIRAIGIGGLVFLVVIVVGFVVAPGSANPPRGGPPPPPRATAPPRPRP